jgi:hypothetical protein
MLRSGMCCLVGLVRTEVSVERFAAIFRVGINSEIGTASALASRPLCKHQILRSANLIHVNQFWGKRAGQCEQGKKLHS